MSKSNKPIYGIQWTAIFDENPELETPGYRELLREMRERYPDRDHPPTTNAR